MMKVDGHVSGASTMPESPTVFVVDDDSAVRNSLAYLIESEGWTVSSFASAASFLEAVPDDVPGCIVTDVRMPGMSGLELQQRLRESHRRIPMIIITAYGDIPSAVRAVQNGAMQYLEKPVDGDVLIECIREALERDRRNRQEHADRSRVEERLNRLTPREYEVYEIMVKGNSSRQIAGELGLSYKTIESHRSQILRKMEVSSVSQLIHLSLSLQPLKATD